MQWWHWLVIGLALCLLELALPAFVLIWLGLAALILGVLVAVLPMPLSAQLLLWAVLSVAMVCAWMRVFRDRVVATRAGTSDQALGEVGLLVSDVMPYQPGEVMFQRPLLGSDRWKCVSTQQLKAGSRVRVIKVEGHSVVIEAA
jgi:membrane protein implicated in regulation of membrane protease activity